LHGLEVLRLKCFVEAVDKFFVWMHEEFVVCGLWFVVFV
jgi:hypothetical protein